MLVVPPGPEEPVIAHWPPQLAPMAMDTALAVSVITSCGKTYRSFERSTEMNWALIIGMRAVMTASRCRLHWLISVGSAHV